MDKYWVWFSRINKIGVSTKLKLLKKYNTPEKIWNAKEEELNSIVTKENSKILMDNQYRENLDIYIEYMQSNNIKMMNIYDDIYPKKLLNIYDPPVVLFAKGNLKALNDLAVAIIGSRNCSNYGENIAKRFAYNLSKANINVISGLARGIDTYAHIGTIKAKGKTIAVLGNGLDYVYPMENTKLYNEIIENNGVILSEYIIGTKPEKINFPARNRIISALSDGVLVVEASKNSGTTITVDFALEHGKNIYAIPRKD